MNIPASLFGNISVDQFLTEYWQKKPLLVRQAMPDFHSPVSPETLAGLACEEAVESRLVIEKDGDHPWLVKHGPFDEDDFMRLPKSHWTLLVQEANKQIPELSELLAHFNFLPTWWFDDIMISYAPDHGTVGPHFDYYDVFLLQSQGKKCWQINTQDVSDENYIPNIDLRIMGDFEAEQDWVLGSGDMLYLPPGVAHHGVAMGESLTYSIGYRAISKVEMMTSFLEHVIEGMSTNTHLKGDDLKESNHPGEISSQILDRVSRIIKETPLSDKSIAHWFGRFITEPKGSYHPELPDEEIEAAALVEHLQSGNKLFRGEHSRFNFICNEDGTVYLYIDGQEHVMTADLAPLAEILCDQPHSSYEDLAAYVKNKDAISLLVQLFNQGQLYMVAE